jgi:hypothetical protein
MGLRKHDDSFASPILSNTKAARTLGGILIAIGVVVAPFPLPLAVSVVFVFAGIGIILLSTSNEVMHVAALGSFGIALFSLGFAAGQLLS